MRIVGGKWRGRALAGPLGPGIRPTQDRLRESLFNILAHRFDDPVSGARVLDLFAGTGALGFEALSRGADLALFVDDGDEAQTLIQANAATFRTGDVTRVLRRDASRLGPNADAPFTLVFLDPPYGKGLAERALKSAMAGQWLAPQALVIVEESRGAFTTAWGFTELERRDYDDTQFTFLRVS